MERPDYNGVKFWSLFDWAFSSNYELAIEKLNSNRDLSSLSDINEIIELYEIYQIVTCKGLKEEYSKPYLEKAKSLIPIVARFFKTLNDENLESYYSYVCVHYIDGFWDLFEKFSCFNSVSKDAMQKFLMRDDIALYRIIEHEKITIAYDNEIANVLIQSDQTARMIVSEYLEEHNDKHKKLYFPKSLLAKEYEGILQKYIDSEHPNAGVLQLIWQSQSSAECPISDQLRLNAKRRSREFFSTLSGVTTSFGIGVSIAPIKGLIEVENKGNNDILYKYNLEYLEGRLDYKCIIENFSTIFAFTDTLGRSRFPSISSRLEVFERTFGVKGAKEYKTGSAFHVEELRSAATMQAYYHFLKDKGINIENVISWFFSEYIRDNYGIAGYSFNASSENSGFAEKCKNISSEMESTLKQYKMYLDTGDIDRELFEIASSAITLRTLLSQVDDKYAYVCSDRLKQEMFLLFSDQSLLAYLPDHKEYSCFLELAETERIKLEDYKPYEKASLDYLISRQTIYTDSTGYITLNHKRVVLLKDLYDNDVLCLKYCGDYQEIIDDLIANEDIEIESRLFTRPESDYLNYMLNKSTFSNGLDLRNKYAHGTYSKDENVQVQDYISLLKIMIMILLKIKEEFEKRG